MRDFPRRGKRGFWPARGMTRGSDFFVAAAQSAMLWLDPRFPGNGGNTCAREEETSTRPPYCYRCYLSLFVVVTLRSFCRTLFYKSYLSVLPLVLPVLPV